MNVPFFYNVPSWMIRYISGERCSECGTPVSKKNIIAIGIRQHQNQATPYIEHECSKCKFRAITSFGGHKKGTLQELCYMLLEELQNKNKIRVAIETEGIRKKTKMTDKEVSDFLKRLDKATTYDELLKEIGATGYQSGEEKKKQ